jgi:hypothetical protein
MVRALPVKKGRNDRYVTKSNCRANTMTNRTATCSEQAKINQRVHLLGMNSEWPVIVR